MLEFDSIAQTTSFSLNRIQLCLPGISHAHNPLLAALRIPSVRPDHNVVVIGWSNIVSGLRVHIYDCACRLNCRELGHQYGIGADLVDHRYKCLPGYRHLGVHHRTCFLRRGCRDRRAFSRFRFPGSGANRTNWPEKSPARFWYGASAARRELFAVSVTCRVVVPQELRGQTRAKNPNGLSPGNSGHYIDTCN